MVKRLSYSGEVTYRRLASGRWAIVAEDGYVVDIIDADPDERY